MNMNDKRTCNTSIRCSLDSIKVGCCDCAPTKWEGTECASFKLGAK